ncbi:DUF6252 family protein [Mesonia aquimarina]|uniref:DUF6252 family protein n=1 Tax=Mesonia aquimarina TaxID=1504967 RepID=UPI000EF62315|nr:DUF6252 family protein [Mesonia aquimarina]
MKKLFLLTLIAVLGVVSCSDEIESNTPSIQGEANGEFFRARNSSATINQDGSVTMVGTSSEETISLTTASIDLGTYALGNGNINEATFENVEGDFYTTGSTGFGQIEITKVEAGKLSGEFYFDARKDETGDTLNFNKGFFFEVPLTNPGSGGEVAITCQEAQTATAQASQAFANGDPDNQEEYETLCLAYKAALDQQIEACGDESGDLQTALDALPCANENSVEGVISVTAGTLEIDFDEVSIVTEDGLVKVTGETSAQNDYNIYFEVAENITGDDMMQNFEISLISVYYPSTLPDPNDFNNNVSTNAAGTIIGTFSGLVQNDDGGDLSLTSGTFDLSY